MNYHGRLALYLACADRTKEPRITSVGLAERTGISDSQVRRDISQAVGPVGTRGVGYKPEVLSAALAKIVAVHADQIKLDARQDVANGVLVLSRLGR